MLLTIFGTRPEIIKMAPLLPLLDKEFEHSVVYTSQHFSANMAGVFFEQLQVRKPDASLNLNSSNTAGIEKAVGKEIGRLKPDAAIVYGDTNSTVAAARAAGKAGVQLIHLEAGLRSFDKSMPEERNRIEADKLSNLLLAPTGIQVRNLRKEGIGKNVFPVGNLISDALEKYLPIARRESKIMERLEMKKNRYVLATAHRTENVDSPAALKEILECMRCDESVVYPIHPRTRKNLEKFRIPVPGNVKLVDPLGYFDFLQLEENASVILTDSGGVQEEAINMHVPCLTLRDSTERWETIAAGGNILVGKQPALVRRYMEQLLDPENPLGRRMRETASPYGTDVAGKCLKIMKGFIE